MRSPRFLFGAALVVMTLVIAACGTTSPSDQSSGSASSTTGVGGSSSAPQELRDVRYCEVIPSVQQGSTVTTSVYNTLGYNYCPPGKWNKLTEDQVNQEYGSQSAKLNGPRHWVIDAAQSTGGNSSSTKTFTFGGIETGLKGVITTQANQPTVGDQFYTSSEVARSTIWTYKAGKPVFELTGPDGSLYIMQSYAQIADKTLTYHQLAALGGKLKLPAGWSYKSLTLTTELNLNSNGLATVVNDDLYDSYQKM